MTFDKVYEYTQHLSLLYVEDEEKLRQSTLSLLENYFRCIDVAKDGREGLEHYKEALKDKPYDIVLSDINMPYLNGLEMLKEIRTLSEDQIVIFLSAHHERDYLFEAIKLGVSNFLLKPVNLNELSKTLFRSAQSIVNQSKVQVQLAEEKSRLEQIERYQKALLQWASVDFLDVEDSINMTTELSAQAMNVGRVSIWLLNRDETAIVCRDLYVLKEDEHSSGLILEEKDFPSYFKAMKKNRIMVIDEARTDHRTSEFTQSYLEPLGIYSMLDIPIMQEGRLLGVVCHEAIGSIHRWSLEEQEFAMSLSNNIALAFEINRRNELQDELKNQTKKLDYQAHHDELTALPNRTLFTDRLEQAIKQSRRNKRKIALLFIDLDHFKEINDSLGHEVGDKVLKVLAKRLVEQIREGDTLARLGGDEFTLILENISESKVVVDIIQKLLLCTREAIQVDGHELYITLSIGVSVYPNDGDTVELLLKNADAAMYKAKEDGRNTYQYYTQEMTEKAVKRVLMETSLRHAMDRQEFVLFYQPQYKGLTDELVGMEALIRWNKTDEGLINPNAFIPLAEESGMIVELDRWVIKTAIEQFSKWHDKGLDPGKLSLNLSIKQLLLDDFVPFLEDILARYTKREEWLEFEITEGRIMKDPEAVVKILHRIKAMGIKLSIEDFGTGYSSLSYLKRLPIDTLKIDHAFIRDLPESKDDRAVVKAIIALGKSLHLNVIAEGVETVVQKEYLIDNGCDLIQGHYYEKALSTDEIEKKLLNMPE